MIVVNVNHKPLIYSTYTLNSITKHRYRVFTNEFHKFWWIFGCRKIYLENNSRDHCHTLQIGKPTSTSDSTRETCESRLKTEPRTHHPKGRPTYHSSRLAGPATVAGRPVVPLWRPLALRRLIHLPKIWTLDFKAILGRFIQQWSRELTRIDDVAIPCPLLHLGLYKDT
jgi:hypothetical protein